MRYMADFLNSSYSQSKDLHPRQRTSQRLPVKVFYETFIYIQLQAKAHNNNKFSF